MVGLFWVMVVKLRQVLKNLLWQGQTW